MFSSFMRSPKTSSATPKSPRWGMTQQPVFAGKTLPSRHSLLLRGPTLTAPRMRNSYAPIAAPDKVHEIDLWELFEAAEHLDAPADAKSTKPQPVKGAPSDHKGDTIAPLSIAAITPPPKLGRLDPQQWAVLRTWREAQEPWLAPADPKGAHTAVGSADWLLTALKQESLPSPELGAPNEALKQMLMQLARYDAPRSDRLRQFRIALTSCRGLAQTAMLTRQYFSPSQAGRLTFMQVRGHATSTPHGKDDTGRAELAANWQKPLAPLRHQRLQEASAKFQHAKNYAAFLKASGLTPAVFDEVAFALLSRGAIFEPIFDMPKDAASGIDFFTHIGKILAECKKPGEFAYVILYLVNSFTGKKTQPALIGISPDGRVSFSLGEVIVGAHFDMDPTGREHAWGISWDGFDTGALHRQFPSVAEHKPGAAALHTYATEGLPPAAYGKGLNFEAFTEHVRRAAATTRKTLGIEFDGVAPNQALARLTEETKNKKFTLDLATYERLASDQLLDIALDHPYNYGDASEAGAMVDKESIAGVLQGLEAGQCVEVEDEPLDSYLYEVSPAMAAVLLSDRGLMPATVRKDYLGDKTTTFLIDHLVRARNSGEISAEAAKLLPHMAFFVRKVTESDKEAMRHVLASLTPEDFRTRFSGSLTIDEAVQVHLDIETKKKRFSFGVFDRGSANMIGLGMFELNWFPTPVTSVSLALTIDPKYRGKKVANDVVRWGLAVAHAMEVRRWEESWVLGNKPIEKVVDRMVKDGFATPLHPPEQRPDPNDPSEQAKIWVFATFKLNPSAGSPPLIEAHGALSGEAASKKPH